MINEPIGYFFDLLPFNEVWSQQLSVCQIPGATQIVIMKLPQVYT